MRQNGKLDLYLNFRNLLDFLINPVNNSSPPFHWWPIILDPFLPRAYYFIKSLPHQLTLLIRIFQESYLVCYRTGSKSKADLQGKSVKSHFDSIILKWASKAHNISNTCPEGSNNGPRSGFYIRSSCKLFTFFLHLMFCYLCSKRNVCWSVRPFERTDEARMELRFLQQNVDRSLGYVHNEDSIISDLIEAA